MVLQNAGLPSAGKVLGLAREGRFVQALALGEQILARQANDPGLNHLVGVIACQAGNPSRGAQLLAKAFEVRQSDSELGFNLAKALADSGKTEAALALCSRIAGARFERLRAEILKSAGKPREAAAAYEHYLASNQNDADAWSNLGSARMAAGQTGAALEALQTARQLAPGSITVLRNLARALQLNEREAEALDVLREAHELAPGDVGVLQDHGEALMRMLYVRESLGVMAEAGRLDPKNPEILVSIGLAYAALGEFEQAEEAYFRALALDPRSPAALLNLGVLLEQSNRIDKLRELAQGALARGADGEMVTLLQVLVLRREGKFEEALELAKGLDSGEIDEISLSQTIAQLADRTGAIDLAFESFRKMNQLVSRTPFARHLDGTEHRQFVEGMSDLVTAEWIAGWSALPSPDGADPAFLVGFPRSGTTLLDTALMGHSRIHVFEEEPLLRTVADEAGPLSAIARLSGDDIENLRFRYLEEAAKIAPEAAGKLILDKMPLNILRGPHIARLFPRSPIIFAIRHPCDAVLSCFMQNFRVNQAMASFLDLENAARFYDATMAYWAKCRELLPLSVLEVRYEDLVADHEAVLRSAIEFLQLPWEESVLRHQDTAASRGYIRTPSYAQVTEGMYKRSAGRWERYRKHMEPVLGILAPWAIRFGYPDPRT